MLANFTSEQINELGALLNSFGYSIVPRAEKSNPTYIESRYFKITAQVDIPAEGETDASTEYKAVEVTPDGLEAPVPITFDSDATPTGGVGDPIIFPNLKINSELFSGSVEVGKAYHVEEVEATVFGDPSDWYVIPKGGAGGGLYRIKCLEDITMNDTNYYSSFELIDDRGDVVDSDIIVLQRKFTEAKIEEGEILYAIDTYTTSGISGYLLDPFLAGIGGSNA